MNGANLPIPQLLQETISAEWHRLSGAGTWWNGQERVAIAQQARRARAASTGEAVTLTEAARAAVAQIETRAHEIDQAWVAGCQDRDLAPLAMVELLAITAKISAIDTFLTGVGRQLPALPQPREGEPSRETVDGAKIDHGWLPTRGPAGAPNCFSAVGMEHDALHEFHSSFYISLPEMRDLELVKDLHRSQLELVAARTSFINDCFY